MFVDTKKCKPVFQIKKNCKFAFSVDVRLTLSSQVLFISIAQVVALMDFFIDRGCFSRSSYSGLGQTMQEELEKRVYSLVAELHHGKHYAILGINTAYVPKFLSLNSFSNFNH